MPLSYFTHEADPERIIIDPLAATLQSMNVNQEESATLAALAHIIEIIT